MDDSKIQSVYCQDLEKHFLQLLGAKHVRALDYQVRHYHVPTVEVLPFLQLIKVQGTAESTRIPVLWWQDSTQPPTKLDDTRW